MSFDYYNYKKNNAFMFEVTSQTSSSSWSGPIGDISREISLKDIYMLKDLNAIKNKIFGLDFDFLGFDAKKISDMELNFILRPENVSHLIERANKYNLFTFADDLQHYQDSYSCFKPV